MTGQDFQDKLDALVADMTGKPNIGTEVALRAEDNTLAVRPLSTDANGVVNAAQLQTIQTQINGLKVIADDYEAARAPVTATSQAFKTAQTPHENLIEAARVARVALNDALTADADYQTAKTALDNAKADPAYVNSSTLYATENVSENFGNLSDAKGKYHPI